MVARHPAKRSRTRHRPSSLTALLIFAIVFEILVAVWSMTHFGCGVSSISLKRFPEWGAEGLFAIAASTAAFGWFTLQWKRWGAWGMLTGFAVQVFWYYVRSPQSEGLPSSFFSTVLLLTVAIAVGLAMLLSRIWADLEQD
ncbi:MAG: hypothetical protein JW751_32380 [Polyangiaceae bacterium]|nr:hypothetical protein [Polyangiaceae bacterium]